MVSKATLHALTQDFIDDMIAFSSASVEWCAAESERAAKTVGDAMHFLVNDSKRISSMSEETIALLRALRAKSAPSDAPTKAAELITALKQLSADHADIPEFAAPVIEALQFQDRVTQQMENMVRMIAVWAATRTSLTSSPELSSADRLEFGKALLACTTMIEERDVVRSVITDLPEEVAADTVQLF